MINKYFMMGGRPVVSPSQSAAPQQMSIQPPIDQYAPKGYEAPPPYSPFAQSFAPNFNQSQVTDVYQRGAMPNELLSRYNAMAKMLQQQQAAMIPRTKPQANVIKSAPSQYINFAQLFGGGNGR